MAKSWNARGAVAGDPRFESIARRAGLRRSRAGETRGMGLLTFSINVTLGGARVEFWC
jgi:hypothetical protein